MGIRAKKILPLQEIKLKTLFINSPLPDYPTEKKENTLKFLIKNWAASSIILSTIPLANTIRLIAAHSTLKLICSSVKKCQGSAGGIV